MKSGGEVWRRLVLGSLVFEFILIRFVLWLNGVQVKQEGYVPNLHEAKWGKKETAKEKSQKTTTRTSTRHDWLHT
jgi:hypothetical protein